MDADRAIYSHLYTLVEPNCSDSLVKIKNEIVYDISHKS